MSHAVDPRLTPQDVEDAWARLCMRRPVVVSTKLEAIAVGSPLESLRPALDVDEVRLATSMAVREREMRELARRILSIRESGEVAGRLTTRQSLELGLLATDLSRLVLAS